MIHDVRAVWRAPFPGWPKFSTQVKSKPQTPMGLGRERISNVGVVFESVTQRANRSEETGSVRMTLGFKLLTGARPAPFGIPIFESGV